MIVCETPRLRLRHMTSDDAGFILQLLNEPDFIRYIGDRQVRTLDDARLYIQDGPVASYARHGFGLYVVESRENSTSIGICGLLKRAYLEHVDVGIALSATSRGQGYGSEAMSAVLRHGHEVLELGRIVAITAPDNQDSIRLLGRLGFTFERMIRTPDSDRETRLFVPS